VALLGDDFILHPGEHWLRRLNESINKIITKQRNIPKSTPITFFHKKS
jgi:hypothetical protein